jgi:soluble lytic murein transglycosylase-like protein
MPATARWRGLADPFDPLEAIAQSAKLLRDLRREFGNLGLAAAAYNAGPGRVRDWLAGRRGLPRETCLGLILESCSAANSVHAGRTRSLRPALQSTTTIIRGAINRICYGC